jgi:hypothetical protein
MQVTINLSDKQVAFLQKMVLDMKKYKNIGNIEEAIKECVNMAMYEDGEHTAMQEGM